MSCPRQAHVLPRGLDGIGIGGLEEEEEEEAAVTATAAFIASVTPKTRGGRSGLPLYQPSEKKQDLESTLGE